MNNTEKALNTWYPVDNPKHFDLLHPALALAGETGELLDLLKKHLFKPGVSWNDKLDAELGDWSYYDRVIDYIINNTSFTSVRLPEEYAYEIVTLVTLNYVVAHFVYRLIVKNDFNQNSRLSMQQMFGEFLSMTDKDYQDIVDKNFVKLNPDDGSKHGWANAK